MADTATVETAEEAGPVLMITEAAQVKVAEVMAAEEDAGNPALRVEIVGVNGADYAYDLSLEELSTAVDGDAVYKVGDIDVMIPAASIDHLQGATLDLPSNPGQGGLVIRNPNRPNPLGDMSDLVLEGDIAEQVRMLLEARINPALASHGGFASLVGVEEADDGTAKVFVSMGGGCQGCSLSAATLSQGIKAAIVEAIPAVTEVIDTTDHTSGDNPFYS